MRTRTCFGVVSAATIVLLAGVAPGADVDVVFSRANGASSVVPGAVDTAGNPAAANFNSMLEFWLSPDGSRFLLRGSTSQPTAESDSYLLLGSGMTGTVVLQEGRPFPGAVNAELVDFFSSSVCYPFNAANDWAFALRAKGGVASMFQKIIRVSSAGTGVLRFQMGDLYTGTTDNPVGNAGNETIGNSASTITLQNNGVIGWVDPNPGNLSSTRYPVSAYDAVRFLQSNADTVTRLDGSGPIGLSSISSTGTISNFWTSNDGTRVVVRGKADVDGNLSSLSDPDCVVVDGRIVAQAAQPLPGDPSITVLALNQTSVAANNDWYIRGTMTGGAWAVKNGAVIAKTGDAIGGDTWGTATFFTIGGTSNGDYYLAGKTSNADTARDDVIAVNGQVVLREGDAVSVDLDNDGIPDTAYIGRSNITLSAFGANNSAGLAPDGTLYVIANLRTAADGGSDVAPAGVPYALLRVSPDTTPVCGTADFDGDGDIGTDADIEAFFACLGGNCCATCFPGGADFNGDGDVGTDADIEAFFRVLAGGNC